MSLAYMEMAPTLTKIIEAVTAANPLQRKRIGAFLSQQDLLYFEQAEAISRALVNLGATQSLGPDDLAVAYNEMVREMLRLQIDFRKTGRYRDSSFDEAAENIYQNPDRMLRYMLGLALSQVLWANHYKIYRFFGEVIGQTPVPGRYLEIGAGHGLYLAAAMEQLPDAEFSVLDISQTALDFTGGILQAFGLDRARATMICDDAFNLDQAVGAYDLVTMGEVLEHVESPEELLTVVGRAVSSNGRMFITTCANCPAVDHIYLFHNVADIRDLFQAAGFEVEEERFWAAEPVPEEDWERDKVTINYAAVIRPVKNRYGD
jgi:SAM-dependent methyltransferase